MIMLASARCAQRLADDGLLVLSLLALEENALPAGTIS